MNLSSFFYYLLNFMTILDYLKDTKTLVSKLYIYSDFEIPPIKTFLDHYHMTIPSEYIFGDFRELLHTKLTDEKTTYVFSDIENLNNVFIVSFIGEYSLISNNISGISL